MADKVCTAKMPAIRRFIDTNKPDEPVLFCSTQALHERAKLFKEGFPGTVSYAVKANPYPGIIKTLAQAGIDIFDVASLEELDQVLTISPGCKTHYHNPVKSEKEIATAFFHYDCRRFAVDHISELGKINRVIPQTGRQVEIAIRFRLPHPSSAAHNFSRKFGASVYEAAQLLQHAAAMGFTAGLTFHPGSQCTDPAAYRRHIEVAAEIIAAAKVPVAFLNTGGGFPAAYGQMPEPNLEHYFAAIKRARNSAFKDTSIALECEPGRAMVAGSLTLVSQVKATRSNKAELFLNDGIYGSLLEPTQALELLPRYSSYCMAPSGSAGEQRSWTTYGPTCDPLDVLPGKLELPADIQPGDYVIFSDIGAYSNATSTRFNGYGNAEFVLL